MCIQDILIRSFSAGIQNPLTPAVATTLPLATLALASVVFLTVPECENLAMQKFST